MTFIEWWQKLGIFHGRDTVGGLIEPMAFAALTWEAAQPKWQPIETAPKGCLVDIWIVHRGGGGVRWCNCYYDKICDEWRTSRPTGRLLSIKARHVTHWMSRPQSPGVITMIDLVIWPDNEWCYLEELEEYAWKSDDYVRTSVPDWVEEENYPKYDDVIKHKTLQWDDHEQEAGGKVLELFTEKLDEELGK